MDLNDLLRESQRYRQPQTQSDTYIVVYPAIALGGEVGEIQNLVKKFMRGDMKNEEELRERIQDELGDVLWYVRALADDLNLNLDHIAQLNISKLRHRYGDS